MAKWKREIDYIQVITDLKNAGRSNKEELARILYRNDIPKVESLERRVLDFIFSVTEDELRFKLIDNIAEANNLPIIHECYNIICSGFSKEEYIKVQVMNLSKSRESLGVKYDLCLKIIGQSALLQDLKKKIAECRVAPEDYKGRKVVSHRYRNRIAKRD